jgi:hypothetical protein
MHGLATISEGWLDDAKPLDFDSMFVAHDLVLHLSDHTALYLCCRSRYANACGFPVRYDTLMTAYAWRTGLAAPADNTTAINLRDEDSDDVEQSIPPHQRAFTRSSRVCVEQTAKNTARC